MMNHNSCFLQTKVAKICLIACLFLCSNIFSQKLFVSAKDVFGTRVFIENKGQFNSATSFNESVKFAYESANEHIYFTNNGLIYKLVKKLPLTHEQIEEMEHGKKIKSAPVETYEVNMNWLNANENIQVSESEKQNYYFTYGGPELNSYGYKKLTFKNVYNNIDIEYTIPAEKEYGIKYDIILHPGANPADIKIVYTGDVKKIKENNGEIIIKTPLEEIVEHMPEGFYSNHDFVTCKFKLENKIISFEFPHGYQSNKTLIIDPWVTNTDTLTTNNCGYDVDYDYAGNLFVYGGLNLVKVAKYSPSGVLIWVFSGSILGLNWVSQPQGNTFCNFVINKSDSKTYIAGFPTNVPAYQIIRLDINGNYDNYGTPWAPNSSFDECWDFGFSCGTNEIYAFGGFAPTNVAILNQITPSISPVNVGVQGDNTNCLIDDFGNIFVHYIGFGNFMWQNRIARINQAMNGLMWDTLTGFNNIFYSVNKDNYQGVPNFFQQSFNSLAVNCDYLFFYDGYNLSAYNKNTGVIQGSITVAGYTPKWQGGIAVDNCNNVYIGGNGSILSYNFSAGVFNALPSILLAAGTPYEYVYDIKLDKTTNKLFVCGSGFVGIYNAANSNTCNSLNLCLAGTTSSIAALTVSCTISNAGNATINITTNIVSPAYSYTWTGAGGIVSVTNNTNSSVNTVYNLPNGTYTITSQILSPCGPLLTGTISIDCVDIPTGISQKLNQDHKILIFPNPNRGSFKIQIDYEIKNADFILANVLGEKVHEQKIHAGENNINAGETLPGIYHYYILENKSRVASGKLIIK